MGCVSSKQLKQQASIDGWTSPAGRVATPRAKTITGNYSVECYHRRHLVSLTSTSYGSLKIESPKPAEMRLTHNQAAFTSLNQMYGKLWTSEMMGSSHVSPSRNINSRVQDTFQTCVRKSPSQLDANHQWSIPESLEMMDSATLCNMNSLQNTLNPCVYQSLPQLEENHQRSINSAESGFPETINVKEMMMGLEEAALSHGSSPVKQAPSTLGTPKAKTLEQSRNLKKKVDAMENMASIRYSLTTPAAEWSEDDSEFGKENMRSYAQQHIHPTPKSGTSTRIPLDNTPLSHSSYKSSSSVRYPASPNPVLKPCQPSSMSMKSPLMDANRAWESQPIMRGSIVARKAAVERGSPSTGFQICKSSSPGLSSTSSASARSVQYVSSNGKVKLTLQTQHCNNAATTFSPSNPSQPMSRRGSFASAESSSPTFDPNLVASYEKALKTISQDEWNASHANITEGNRYSPGETANTCVPFLWSSKSKLTTELDKKLYDPLECFKVKCPPGGEMVVVLYTTTLHGIRKTFENCNTTREILQSFGLSIDERDVSMHLDFLNELRELMDRVVSVPQMFIKGRYIGGIEQVVKLYEDGTLSELVEGLPKQTDGGNCDGCGGVRFVPCLECSGSCKLRSEEDNTVTRCPDCNENGLIQCPICT